MTIATYRKYIIHPVVLAFFFAFCFLLAACGKKGDPTLKSYEIPESPSNLRAVLRPSEITLFWDFPKKDNPAIKGFHICKSTGGDFAKVAFLENSKRSFTDTDLRGASQLAYKIIAENLRGIMSKDPGTLAVHDIVLPLPPAGVSFTLEYDTLILSWKSAGEGITYNIYKRMPAGDPVIKPVNAEPLKDTSFRDTFDISRTVFYTIRSVRQGDIVSEGPVSGEIMINPAELVPSPPSNLQAVPSGDSVYLIWKEPLETWVKGYRVYRETSRKEGFVLIGETQIPSFVDKEKPSKKRHYRVTSQGPVRESKPAEVRDIISAK